MQTKTRFKSLPAEVRADRRRMALKKIEGGWSRKEAADLAEVHYKTIETWLKNKTFLENNEFHEHKRGREKEEQKILTSVEQVEILDAIKNSTPDKEGIEYFLWSRKAVRECIEKKCHKTLAFQTISDYTKRWGLSSQRPKKQASEQDAEKVRIWLEEEYPKIQKKPKKKTLKFIGRMKQISISTQIIKKPMPRRETRRLQRYQLKNNRFPLFPPSPIKGKCATWCTKEA